MAWTPTLFPAINSDATAYEKRKNGKVEGKEMRNFL